MHIGKMQAKARGYGMAKKPKYVVKKRTIKWGRTHKHLVYTPWFKEFVEKNKGVIEAFMEARKSHAKQFIRGEIEVQRISHPRELSDIYIWRVNAGEKSFFVKEVRKRPIAAHREKPRRGAERIEELRNLQTLLSQHHKSHIELAKYRAAWENPLTTLLVTDFYDLPKRIPSELPREIAKELSELADEASRKHGIKGLEGEGFYNPIRKKFIIY